MTIEVDSLRSAAGNTIESDRINVHPVGYVDVKLVPVLRPLPLEREYQGWWPDPLLENFAFDVQRGNTQPVWLAVSVPLDQPAGIYQGKVHIKPTNAPAHALPLEVQVADYALPQSNPWAFKNLLSWWSVPPREFYKDDWTPELQRKFFDFLLDRRVNVLSMYGNEPYETVANMEYFASRGQNVFLLHWYTQETYVRANDAMSMRHRLDQFVPHMRKLGLIDRAYVYGWDEIGQPDTWPGLYDEVRYAAQVLADDYPGVRLLAAGTDSTYGTDSPLKGLANFSYCPFMVYDRPTAKRAQANGNDVWWYDTYWTIDQHLIRSRLIPWQTFKLNADGFLIWCLNRWKNNDTPIGKQILTDWNPLLDGSCPTSSAMYIYPGENGPISSLRLENFRDGIEDYELLVAARKLLQKVDNGDARAQLAEAITISDELTSDLLHYTPDTTLLFAHRRRLIEALVAADGR